MRTVFALVIDLRWDVDMLAVSVLSQAAPNIAEQNLRRVRAAAQGISAPLDADAFADPRRLLVDAAAAQALRQCLGSDAAVRSWTENQLRKVAARRVDPVGRTAVRMDGLTLGIPFALGPLKLLSSMDDGDRRVRWIDNQIRMPSSRRSDTRHAYSMATCVLLGTPLEGRLMVASSAWSRDGAVPHEGRRSPRARCAFQPRPIGDRGMAISARASARVVLRGLRLRAGRMRSSPSSGLRPAAPSNERARHGSKRFKYP